MTGKRIFPHLLRHSCAAHTLEATGDIREVSLWLGRASIQSTEIYLRREGVEPAVQGGVGPVQFPFTAAE